MSGDPAPALARIREGTRARHSGSRLSLPSTSARPTSSRSTSRVDGRYFAIREFLRLLRAGADMQGEEVKASGRLFGVDSIQFAGGTATNVVSATLTVTAFAFRDAVAPRPACRGRAVRAPGRRPWRRPPRREHRSRQEGEAAGHGRGQEAAAAEGDRLRRPRRARAPAPDPGPEDARRSSRAPRLPVAAPRSGAACRSAPEDEPASDLLAKASSVDPFASRALPDRDPQMASVSRPRRRARSVPAEGRRRASAGCDAPTGRLAGPNRARDARVAECRRPARLDRHPRVDSHGPAAPTRSGSQRVPTAVGSRSPSSIRRRASRSGPGYFVVYTGPFDTLSDVQRSASEVRGSGSARRTSASCSSTRIADAGSRSYRGRVRARRAARGDDHPEHRHLRPRRGFSSGFGAINRASKTSIAGAIADQRMEALRRGPYDAITAAGARVRFDRRSSP